MIVSATSEAVHRAEHAGIKAAAEIVHPCVGTRVGIRVALLEHTEYLLELSQYASIGDMRAELDMLVGELRR